MSNQGIGPTGDDRRQSGAEHLSFPPTTASDDLSGALKRLHQIDTTDRNSGTVSLERIVFGLRALEDAESQYSAGQTLNGKGGEALRAVLEALCDMSQKTLSDLKARKKDVSADQIQLSAVLGDRLASMWARYFVAEDAEREVLPIAKNLCSIFDLGKLRNIDDLPNHIAGASHLSPLARFGLWGVSQAYFQIFAEHTKLEKYSQRVSMYAFKQADAARQLAEAPPHELALLTGGSPKDKAQEAFKVALELLMKSVRSATAAARAEGNILRAQKVSELVIPFIERLNTSQIRSWMTDYSMTCRQAQELNESELGFAQQMWKRLEELAHNVGDSVAVEALRFTARRIRSDMSVGDLASASRAVETFRTKFDELQPQTQQELSSDAMSVGQAAISLLLKDAHDAPYFEEARSFLSDACKELDTLTSLAQVNPSIGSFMVVESMLEVASLYLKRDEIEHSRDRALGLWQRARALLDEMDERSPDGVLYSRITCRIHLAELAAFFDDRDIEEPQQAALRALLVQLRTKLELEGLQDYERRSYEFAQVNLLRTLAAVECSLDQEASGSGIAMIRHALRLYERYSISDADFSLLRTLFEVAIQVYEKNNCFNEATQFRQKLERL